MSKTSLGFKNILNLFYVFVFYWFVWNDEVEKASKVVAALIEFYSS